MLIFDDLGSRPMSYQGGFGKKNAAVPVVLYRIIGGAMRFRVRRIAPKVECRLGKPDQDIKAAEVVWEFFKPFKRIIPQAKSEPVR